MPTTRKRAKGSVRQEVWVGDIAALRQLIKQVEELAMYVQDKLIASNRDAEDARREKFLADYSFMTNDEAREERWRQQSDDRLKEIESATQVLIGIEQGRWSMNLSGDPETVLADIDDVSDVKRVQITLAGSSQFQLDGYDLTIDLDKRSADAWFHAPESHFIDLAGRRLEEQFRRQRPWYWWFRATWAVWVFVGPVAVASYFVSTALTNAGVDQWLALIVQTMFNAIFVWGSYLSARTIANPFELVPDGEKGRGRRSLSRIGTILVWIMGTVAVPLLLNVLAAD